MVPVQFVRRWCHHSAMPLVPIAPESIIHNKFWTRGMMVPTSTEIGSAGISEKGGERQCGAGHAVFFGTSLCACCTMSGTYIAHGAAMSVSDPPSPIICMDRTIDLVAATEEVLSAYAMSGTDVANGAMRCQ
eukprot:3455408-Rhodomonas_salina.4